MYIYTYIFTYKYIYSHTQVATSSVADTCAGIVWRMEVYAYGVWRYMRMAYGNIYVWRMEAYAHGYGLGASKETDLWEVCKRCASSCGGASACRADAPVMPPATCNPSQCTSNTSQSVVSCNALQCVVSCNA